MANFRFHTDDPSGMLNPVEYSQCEQSPINGINSLTVRKSLLIASKSIRLSSAGIIFWFHDSAPTEPITDGSLNNTDHTGEVIKTYSRSGNGIIKSFTSETGIFTSNQTFNGNFLIRYKADVSGLTAGWVATTSFEFYKRNPSNLDTLLFVLNGSCPTRFPRVTLTISGVRSGTVTTADRLRLRINMFESPPA